MKTLSVFLFLSLMSQTIAGNVPTTLYFKEGESFSVKLSQTDLNRIAVKGERIVKIRFPEGTFHVDKSDAEDEENSIENSIYIKPFFQEELTLFITTNKRHNVALQIKGDESSGKIVQLISNSPISPKKTTHVSSQKKRKDSIEVYLMKAFQADQMPQGFTEVALKKPSYHLEKLKMTLEKAYQGKGLKSYIYRIENPTNAEVAIKREWFLRDRAIKRLHLTQETLAPNQVAYVCSTYQDKPGSNA